MELHEALAISDAGRGATAGGGLVAEVHAGWDVFGIPHGGYLAALAAAAVLRGTGAPDVFSITTHYLRKAVVGPMAFEVRPVGGSRRFTTASATGVQDGQVVLAVMASVGDRTGIEGPTWTDAPAPGLDEAQLRPPAGDPALGFPTPTVAQRMRMRLDDVSTRFATGGHGGEGRMRAVCEATPTDQLAALVACDLTPPAVWNAVGATGWVPTVELTAHVRARPVEGPLTIDAVTHHVADGFLEEDAVVHDAAGRLVVQSRQLARYAQAPPGSAAG